MDTWREIVARKQNTCTTNKQVNGPARTKKAKASPGMGKGKGKPDRGKGRKGKHHGKKKKNVFHEMEEVTKRKTHKPVKITQDGRTQVGITLTSGMTQIGGQTFGSQICGMTWHGNKRHDSWCCRSLLKNTLKLHKEAASQCLVDCRCANCQLVTRDSKINMMEEEVGARTS